MTRWEQPADGHEQSRRNSTIQVRPFPRAIEKVSKLWREQVVTEDNWDRTDKHAGAGGEAAGFWVCCGDLDAWAKPGKNIPPVTERPRAALEKIASDFAYTLELPIPPALLWRRRNVPAGEEEFAVVSLMPFDPAHKWHLIKQEAERKDRFLAFLGPLASAMVPFDTWVDNVDRVNEGNLIGKQGDGDEAGLLQAAYIDYAHSMVYPWGQQGKDWRIIIPAAIFPEQCAPDFRAMARSISCIEALSDDIIAEVIERIPEEFLAPQHRDTLVQALLHRRDHLRETLSTKFQELT